MTDIEQKALALVNEVRVSEHRCKVTIAAVQNEFAFIALCRAIEQHEALRQEVSDAITECWAERYLRRFIIAKPDPLVEVLADMGLKPKGGYDWASEFRNTLAQRGGKIVWGER